MDETNGALYWFEFVASNASVTINKLYADGATILHETFALSPGADSNDRISDIEYLIDTNEIGVGGSWRSAGTDRAQLWYADAPLTGSPSWTNVQGTQQARRTAMITRAVAGAAGRKAVAVAMSVTTRSLARDGTEGSLGGVGANQQDLSWGAYHPVQGASLAVGYSASACAAVKVTASGGLTGLSADPLTVAGPGSATELLGFAPFGTVEVAFAFREGSGVFHPYHYNLSTNTLTEGTRVTASQDLRLVGAYDAGAGEKVWAVNAADKKMWSSTDGLVYAEDTEIGDYPGTDDPHFGCLHWINAKPMIVGDAGSAFVLGEPVPGAGGGSPVWNDPWNEPWNTPWGGPW